jgi:hypothetical protein
MQPQPQYESGYQGRFNPNLSTVITSGQKLSGIIQLGGFELCGLFIPAAFTSTAITFLASQDGINFFPVYNTYAGTPLSYVVTPGSYLSIAPVDFDGINYLKIQTGSNEAANRTLYAALKGF